MCYLGACLCSHSRDISQITQNNPVLQNMDNQYYHSVRIKLHIRKL